MSANRDRPIETEDENEEKTQNLELHGCIDFDGNTIRGLKVHPDRNHIVFSTGNKVVIRNMQTDQYHFLSGHTNTISALDVSNTGNYIASGQVNHLGFLAAVILWDFHKRIKMASHESHKERVEAVTFSAKDQFLVSLGGRDCGSLVVWDIGLKKVISGTEASRGAQGDALALYAMNCRDPCFMTGGDGTLIVWKIDTAARSITGISIGLSKVKRNVLCMVANERDEICYCGTSTGDVMKIRLNFHHDLEILEPQKQPRMIGCFTKISKKVLPEGSVELYEMGIRNLLLASTGELLIAAGDGTIDMVVENPNHLMTLKKPSNIAYKLCTLPVFSLIRSTHVKTTVTSLIFKDPMTLLAGTQNCEIFSIDFNTFEKKLLVTCHTTTIFDVAFPYQFSEVFATASKNNIRIWSTENCSELLRIMVPNFTCSKLQFSYDGKSILSAWNDGVVRSFTPLTGRLIFAILNAHNKGVSALRLGHNGKFIVTGGCEGQVRIWSIAPTRQKLISMLKEHTDPVSDIQIDKRDAEAVSASTDGTCIIWDIIRFVRKQVIYSNAHFLTVCYYPSGVHLLTGGSDRKICYWEVLDGSQVRDIEGSASGAINSLDISTNGVCIASGGNDQIVRIWSYQGGNTTHIGIGHSAVVTAVVFSPNGRYVVSTGAAGEIFIWKGPKAAQEQPSEISIAAVAKAIGSGDSADVKVAEENVSKYRGCNCKPYKNFTVAEKGRKF